MLKVNLIFSFFIVFFFAGCMASSFNEMKRDTSIKKKEYTVNQNYQALYKRGLAKAQECHEGGLLTATIISDGKLYTDLEEAEITIYLMGGLGRQMHHGVTLKAIDKENTLLNIYTYFGVETIETLKKEISGECLTCDCE